MLCAVRGGAGPRTYLEQLADEHGGVPVGLPQDALGDHLAVVEGLCGQPHVGQAAGVDELEHLRQTSDEAQPPWFFPRLLRPPGSLLPADGCSGCSVASRALRPHGSTSPHS